MALYQKQEIIACSFPMLSRTTVTIKCNKSTIFHLYTTNKTVCGFGPTLRNVHIKEDIFSYNTSSEECLGPSINGSQYMKSFDSFLVSQKLFFTFFILGCIQLTMLFIIGALKFYILFFWCHIFNIFTKGTLMLFRQMKSQFKFVCKKITENTQTDDMLSLSSDGYL